MSNAMLPSMSRGWIGVDLDATLAHYEPGSWSAEGSIGAPIPAMVDRVRFWLAQGIEVRVFTARAHPSSVAGYPAGTTRAKIIGEIQDWTEKHVGTRLPVTYEKDLYMIELWDDRAVQVVPNTGIAVRA